MGRNRNGSGEHLVSVPEVAGILNVSVTKVLVHAGDKNVVPYFAGIGAVTLETAQRVFEEIEAENAELRRKQLEYDAEQERKLEREREAARRRAARQPRQVAGVALSLPGDDQGWENE